MKSHRSFCFVVVLLTSTHAPGDQDSNPKAPEVKEVKIAGDQETKVQDKLTAQDPKDKRLRRSPCHHYQVKLTAGVYYRIDLMSAAFDSYLRLESSSGQELASDDDGGEGFNSRIVFKATKADAYRIIATSFDGKDGPYVLALRRLTADESKRYEQQASEAKEVKIAGDEVTKVEGRLTAQDPKDKRLRGGPSHHYAIKLEAGTYIRIDLSSTAFDAFLRVESSSGQELANDDDSGGGLNARINFKSTSADRYRIIATSFDGKDGPYVLAVRRLTTDEIKGFERRAQSAKLDKAAKVLFDQGKYSQAEPLLRQALALAPDAGASYTNLGLVLSKLGQYHEAEMLTRKGLDIDRKTLGDEHPHTVISYNNLAADLRERGQYQEAEKLDRKVLALFRKTYGEQNRFTATSYRHLAIDLRFQGQYQEAEKLARTALAIDRKLHGEVHLDTLTSYNTLAGVMAKQHQYEEAEQLSRKVLEIMRKINGEEHRLTASSFNNLGVFLRWQGKYLEAESLDLKALHIYRKALGEDHDATANSYRNLALGSYDRGDYGKAEERFLSAAKGFQQARLRASFTGLGRSAFAMESPLVMLAAVLARNGKPAEAWKYLEDNMARGLLDDLAIRRNRPLSEKEREQEEMLHGQLARIDQRLSEVVDGNKKNPAAAEKLSRGRDQLMSQLLQFQSDMESKYGVSAGRVYDLKKIQASLPADAALVRWFDISGEAKAKDPNGEHWGVVVRRHGSPVWVKLKGSGAEGTWSAKDDQVLKDARRQLLQPDATYDWEALTADLAKQRLAPLQEHLKGVKHLIILPSLASQGIPVEIYAKDYLVSYAPSATIYAWLHENRKKFKGTGDLLALADPVFSAEQAKVASAEKNGLNQILRGKELQALPGTRGEVEAVAGLVSAGSGKVKKLLGPQANVPNLDALAKKNDLRDFRYLHLATHGFADSEGGMNSYLALTSQDFGLMSHGKLTAAHILRTWKLDADLVTLSACQTGLGEYLGGEGYVGFAQALFLAGAHSLVLSQWPVSDWSTTLLMERFYQNLLGARAGLKQPLPKAEALAEAKRWLRGASRREVVERLRALRVPFDPDRLSGERPFEHPHYWAPFILIGDPGRSPEENSPK